MQGELLRKGYIEDDDMLDAMSFDEALDNITSLIVQTVTTQNRFCGNGMELSEGETVNFLMGTIGHYKPTGTRLDDDYRYDCVIANSFGTSTERGSVNADIRYYGENAASSAGCPLIMDRMLADSFSEHGDMPDLIVEGAISNALGGGVGTWGVLEAGHRFMEEHSLNRPLLVGQAAHVTRTAFQARKLGMNPVIPLGLPQEFDRTSAQVWTRHLALWIPHELLGVLWLKKQGKL